MSFSDSPQCFDSLVVRAPLTFPFQAAWVAYCLRDQSTKFFEVGLEFDHDGVKFWENPELGRMSR